MTQSMCHFNHGRQKHKTAQFLNHQCSLVSQRYTMVKLTTMTHTAQQCGFVPALLKLMHIGSGLSHKTPQIVPEAMHSCVLANHARAVPSVNIFLVFQSLFHLPSNIFTLQINQ